MSNADFGILLGLAYQRFVTELNEHLAGRGFDDIRPTYGYVFRALADQRLTTAQLAARLQITSQGMAKIVDEMTFRGYLSKELDLKDARIRLLVLSDRGRRALRAARAFHAGFEEQLGKDGAALRKLLTGLVEGDGKDELARVLRPF